MSPAQNITGLLSLIGGAAGPEGINKGAKEVYNAIKGLLGPTPISEQEFTALWSPTRIPGFLEEDVPFNAP